MNVSKQNSVVSYKNTVGQQRGLDISTQTDFESECGVSLSNEREHSKGTLQNSSMSRESTVEDQQEVGTTTRSDMNADEVESSESEDAESVKRDVMSSRKTVHEQQPELENEIVTVAGMKMKPCGELDVSVSNGRGKMLISGCTFMADGYIILCDSYQDRIWLADTDLKIERGMSLNGKPWDVAAVDDKYIIVTFYEKQQLQFVQVQTYFKKGRTISTGKPCYGVDVAGGLIYVSCFSIHNDGEVKVYSLKGKLKRRIGVSLGGSFSFNQPYYVALQKANVNVAGDFYDLYVSDFASNIVTCLTAEGSFRHQYKNVDLDGPLGLHVRNDQRQFVCGWRSHTVTVADGVNCSTLLTWKNGIYEPYSVVYSEAERKLIVCCLNKLFAFRMLDV